MGRDTSVTNVAGLMIIVMILHHLAFVPIVKVTDYVFVFFMAWFFFKSGMYSNSGRKKNFRDVLSHLFRKLFVPYLILNIVSILFGVMLEYSYSGYINVIGDLKGNLLTIVRTGSALWNGSLWFLLTLFIVRVISKMGGGGKLITRWLCVCSLIIAYGLYKIPITLPWYLGNTALGLFFYNLGCLLKESQYGRWQMFISSTIYVLILCLFDVQFDFWSNQTNSYPIAIVVLIAGCIAVNNVFKMCKFFQNRVFQYVGENAMPFYIIHGLLIYGISFLNGHVLCMGMGYAFFLLNIVVLSIALPLYAFIYNHYKLQ